MSKIAKGKKYSKLIKGKNGRTKRVSYGSKGYKVAPGTKRGDNYCSRSMGQMKKFPKSAKNPNSALRLSRKKWSCSGKYSRKSLENEVTVNYLTADNITVELTVTKSLEFPQDTLLGDDGKLYTFTTDNTLTEFIDDSITKSFEDEVLFDDEAVRLEDSEGVKYLFSKGGLYKDLTFYDELFIDVPVIQIA